ncbi:MAG: hypothetical protein U5R46_19130 [Gammaproteobacteria bacterium]|nr:hypothetical protein [Gammaproteobacteria bacterium]
MLLTRSREHLEPAMSAAGRLLGYLARFNRGCGPDELLGTWLRPELDAGLPALPVRGAGRPGIGIRASFGQSGVWMLCELDGDGLHSAVDGAARLRVVLESFLPAARASGGAGCFLPVFANEVAGGSPNVALRDLRAAFPDAIGDAWLTRKPDGTLTLPEVDE